MVRLVCSQGFVGTLRSAATSAASKPAITPKQQFEGQIKAIYTELAQSGVSISTRNMPSYFGIKSIATGHGVISKFIVTKDPITGGPITFLGKPVLPGVNAYMLPMLKAAEAEILRSGSTYKPAGPHVMGFAYRGMNVGGKPLPNLLSSHAGGLSIDVDPTPNAPTKNGATNRGNIPDEVVLAMVRHGFIWGAVTRTNFTELGNDPMHFQLALHKDDERYQEVLRTSKEGKAYWDALQAAGALPPMAPKQGNI